MYNRISGMTGIDESQINIKATTQEGLGAIGRKEGIAAFASVLLTKD
jgi:2-C-methyl-D-erythritol 2,4-cyclodiphosphate synthase